MGKEARARLKRISEGPCACGSSRAAGECCYRGGAWHKPPAILGLRALPPEGSVAKCYMRELGSCQGGISGEHLISKSIILLLKDAGDFTVSGLPWIAPGVEKSISAASLTANCLCDKHNSALSPLDAAALKLFTSIKSGLEKVGEPAHLVVSGHDIERWLLKTAKAMAASRNLSSGGERLRDVFATNAGVIDMIDDHRHWPAGSGLWCTMPAGATTENKPRFQLQPLTNKQDEIVGLALNILGLHFVLILGGVAPSEVVDGRTAKYRPGKITITYPACVHDITLAWDDGLDHTETLTLQFVRPVDSD